MPSPIPLLNWISVLGDGVTEAVTLGHQSSGDAFGVCGAGEQVAAEIVVGDLVFEDLVAIPPAQTSCARSERAGRPERAVLAVEARNASLVISATGRRPPP